MVDQKAIFERALSEVREGIAMARKAGVICGPVLSLRVVTQEAKRDG